MDRPEDNLEAAGLQSVADTVNRLTEAVERPWREGQRKEEERDRRLKVREERKRLSLALMKLMVSIRSDVRELLKADDALPDGIDSEKLYAHLKRSSSVDELVGRLDKAFDRTALLLDQYRSWPEDTTKTLLEEISRLVRERLEALDQKLAEEGIPRGAADLSGYTLCAPSEIVRARRADVLEHVDDLIAAEQRLYESYKRVVADCGLFAAFSSDSNYGVPHWQYDYFFARDIATVTSDSDGGGSAGEDIPYVIDAPLDEDMEQIVERVKSAAATPYYCALDDYALIVDTFWYGFKEVLLALDALYPVDLRAMDSYLRDVESKVDAHLEAAVDARFGKE